MSRPARREVRISTADGTVVAERCVVAERLFARMRGLLGRSALPPGEGLLIQHAPSVHMFFMRFPIDVVFIDRDRRVLRVSVGLAPWRIAGARGAVAALELPARSTVGLDLAPGTRLELVELPAP